MGVSVENSQVIREVWFRAEKSSLRASLQWRTGTFICKRVLDVVVSGVMAVAVLSWFLPVMALLIWIDSKGPIFFLQRRVGRGGKVFSCIKLRTMVVNEQADELPAVEGDGRITRVGRFLRRTHLDELPQFINVLSGSMSLVGPRPYMLTDSYAFSQMVPGHRFRSFVKPGITGLAQVKGLHGAVADHQTVFNRYQWDAFYVRNVSFWLDIRILRRTLFIFLTQRKPR